MDSTNAPPENAETLRLRYMQTMDDMIKTSELIAKQIETLGAKEAHWNALELKLQENAARAAERFSLNVGGTVFCIAKSHLLSVEGSYFHAKLDSDQWKPESDGAYFIDWNPEHFNRVLDYMRTGELCCDDLRLAELRSLWKTLDYLQLNPGQLLQIAWDPQPCGSGLVLSQEKRVVVSSADRRSVRSVHPCERFSVRLDADARNSCVLVGFAPQTGFTPERDTHTCGWYMFAHDGHLWAQGGIRDKTYGNCRIAMASISFEVDGRSLGVVFTNIPLDELYAALNFSGTRNIQLTLVA